MNDAIRQKSFWLDTFPGDLTPGPPLEGEHRVDVAIVGGGFTGLSTALHLKMLAPETQVLLLERHICGYGASGRNGGFAMTLFGLTKSLTQWRFGRERAIAAQRYMEAAVDYLNELITSHKLDSDWERSGYLLVATSKRQARRLEHEFELARAWGLQGIERWDKAMLRQAFATELYQLGWFEPRCGILNPAKQAREIKRLCEEKGVVIAEQTPVLQMSRDAHKRYHLITPAAHVHADYLVLATNAYAVCFPELRKWQTPVFTHMVVTEPLTPEQMQAIGWRNRAGIEDVRNLIHYYRLTRDNRIAMGGGDVTLTYRDRLDRDANTRIFQHLESHLLKVFPQLMGIRFTHRWGGPVSVTTDMAPVIGFLGHERTAIYALGYIGHGVSMSHYNGLTIAELLLDKPSWRTEMFFIGRRVIPWPPEPIRFILSHAIRGYLKLEDAVLYR